MFGDVAMHEPGARIVRFESNNGVTVRGQKDNVAARGIIPGKVEVRGFGGNCRIGDLGQDGEVMSVEMDLAGFNIVVLCRERTKPTG